MTNAELSRKTGIRPSTIGDWYWELKESINLEHLAKICKVLNCEIGDLLVLEGD
jgi:putative transcriptional regulator